MRGLTKICFGALVVALSACGEIEVAPDTKNDGIVETQAKNIEVNLAMQEARKTLPYFWQTMETARIEFDAAQAARDEQAELRAKAKAKNKNKNKKDDAEISDEIITYNGPNNFGLKVSRRRLDQSIEYIWVGDIARKDGLFYGLLANDPIRLSNLRIGQEIEFQEFQIADWSYSHKGKLYGHYSTRALLSDMAPEEADAMRKILGENPSTLYTARSQ